MVDETMIRWAPRVPQALIHRLYETDARGIYDEELKVGYALLARCESFIAAKPRAGEPNARVAARSSPIRAARTKCCAAPIAAER